MYISNKISDFFKIINNNFIINYQNKNFIHSNEKKGKSDLYF